MHICNCAIALQDMHWCHQIVGRPDVHDFGGLSPELSIKSHNKVKSWSRKTAEQKFPLSLLVRKKNHVTSLFFCFIIFFFFFYTFNATNHLLARQKMLWKLSQLTSVDWIDCVLNQVNEGLNIAVLTWVSSQDSERSVRGDEQGENQGSDHGYVFPPSSKHINTMRWESSCKDRIGFWCENVGKS